MNPIKQTFEYMANDTTQKFGTVTMYAEDTYLYSPPKIIPTGKHEPEFCQQLAKWTVACVFYESEPAIIILPDTDPFVNFNDAREIRAAYLHENSHRRRGKRKSDNFFVKLADELMADYDAIKEGYTKELRAILKRSEKIHSKNLILKIRLMVLSLIR